MTTLLDINKVLLVCSCYKRLPIYRMYFCRHCLDLRCIKCVNHEVDAFYCPNCMENMAMAEAKVRKHRCGNCYDCPSCGHVLITKASVGFKVNPDDPTKQTPQKVYYLACGVCHWSTKDVGIPDKMQPNGAWSEKPYQFQERIDILSQRYQEIATREKKEKEQSKYARKKNYLALVSKFPVLTPRLRKYRNQQAWSSTNDRKPEVAIQLPEAEPVENPEDFNLENFISNPIDLPKITSIEQRHRAPHIQPEKVSELEPLHKHLMVKRSMRCRICEHNLSKSDYNPHIIKFRINLSALGHLPEIKVLPPPGSLENVSRPLPDYYFTILNPDKNLLSNIEHARSHPPLFGKINPRIIVTNAKIGESSEVIVHISNPSERSIEVKLSQLTISEEWKLLGPNKNLSPVIKSAKFNHNKSNDSVEQKLLELQSVNTVDKTQQDDTEKVKESIPDKPIYSTLTFPNKPINIAARKDAGIAVTLESVSTKVAELEPDIAYRQVNRVGIRTKMIPISNNSDVADDHFLPLRAAIRLEYDYLHATRALLSEKKAMVLAQAKNVKSKIQGGSITPSTLSSLTQPATEQLYNLSFVALVDFGDMKIE